MKKFAALFICACICVCVFALPGCAPAHTVTALDLIGKPFTCKTDITVLTAKFSGILEKTDKDNISLELTEPALMSGLTFKKNGDSIGVSMFGLTVSLDSAGTPSASAADILFDIFSEGGDCDVEVRDDEILLLCFTDYDTITVEFDKATLVPTRLHTKNSGVEVLFSDFEITTEE